MSALDLHQVADDLDHAIDGIDSELQHFESAAAPHDAVLARCREHLDILRRISGEIADDINPTPYGGNAMNNIDRAVKHLNSLDRLYAYASGHQPSNAERAQALADTGYLMPDPPSVKFNGDGIFGDIWEDCGVTVHRGRRTLELYAAIEYGELPETLEPDEARQTAYALLAAASYIERNQE